MTHFFKDLMKISYADYYDVLVRKYWRRAVRTVVHPRFQFNFVLHYVFGITQEGGIWQFRRIMPNPMNEFIFLLRRALLHFKHGVEKLVVVMRKRQFS